MTHLTQEIVICCDDGCLGISDVRREFGSCRIDSIKMIFCDRDQTALSFKVIDKMHFWKSSYAYPNLSLWERL